MMSEYTLLTFDEDWGDEFDVYGFTIMKTEKWKLFLAALQSVANTEFSWYFGTNEGYEEDGHFWIRAIKPQEITANQRTVLIETLAPKGRYGNFPLYLLDGAEAVTPELAAYIAYVDS